jgi:hypothetical protein
MSIQLYVADQNRESPKMKYDELMERLGDGYPIAVSEVDVCVLDRPVWIMMYSAPGCLPDYHQYCASKRDALESARALYADDAPRGFMADLRRDGIAAVDRSGYYRVEIVRSTVREVVS